MENFFKNSFLNQIAWPDTAGVGDGELQRLSNKIVESLTKL
jgi:hypothetical protein